MEMEGFEPSQECSLGFGKILARYCAAFKVILKLALYPTASGQFLRELKVDRRHFIPPFLKRMMRPPYEHVTIRVGGKGA